MAEAATNVVRVENTQEIGDILTEANIFLQEERKKSPTDSGFDKRSVSVKDKLKELIKLKVGKNSGIPLENAKQNQEFSLELYQLMVAGREGKSSEETKQTALLTKLLWRLSSLKGKESEAIGRFLSGCRAQAGLMFSLTSLGYLIYTPQSEEEISLLDLHNIDIAAINPQGEILLLDAKSQATCEVNGHRQTQTEVNFEQFTINSRILAPVLTQVASLVGSIDWSGAGGMRRTDFEKLRFACLNVFIPTKKEFMDLYGRMSPANFKQLREGLKKAEIESWT